MGYHIYDFSSCSRHSIFYYCVDDHKAHLKRIYRLSIVISAICLLHSPDFCATIVLKFEAKKKRLSLKCILKI